MVEILVVIAILALLMGIVFKGGSALIARAKVRDTEALFKTLTQAIDAYKSEVNQSRIDNADNAFVGAPPDHPHVFQMGGTTVAGCSNLAFTRRGQLKQNNAVLADGALEDVRASSGWLTVRDPSSLKHGDIRAMVLAMRLRSPKASEILDRIDPRFVRSGAADGLIFDPDPSVTGDEIPLDYYVDAWGNALEYFATCPCNPTAPKTPREQAAIFIFHENNLYPVLASYGPNGSDQLSKDFMDTAGDTTIVGDFWSLPDGTNTRDGLINDELNSDNIYSAEGLKEKLRTGS